MKTRLALTLACAFGLVSTFLRADRVVKADKAVVISGHPDASRLGLDVLHRGGNAIDAFVTVSLSLGVAEPGNSGPGGKLVLLYYDAKTKQVSCMVSIGAAPLHLDVDKIKSLPSDTRRRGWQSVCTPGLIAGLGAAHQKWGTLPWSSLVTPAADFAEQGVIVSPLAADMIAEFPSNIDTEAARIYAPNGHFPKAGDLLKNPDMAHTLRLIAEGGAKAFYTGEIPAKLVAAANAHGSPLTLEDFSQYKPRFLKPVQGSYHGYEVFSSPPPLSGGATVLLTLKTLEQIGFPKSAAPRNADYIDTISRALQQVYPLASRIAGDSPDASAHVDKALSKESIAKLASRAKSADPKHPYPSEPQASVTDHYLDDLDQASTTHLIIADAQGNVVCATQSLALHFGAAVVAPGTGFLLNDDINNFAYQQTSSVNYAAPGKWPRSTMAPTIILKNSKPILAIGSPAGQRIPVMILQVVLDILDFGRKLDDAVPAPRFHLRHGSTAEPNQIDLESGSPPALSRELEAKGWQIFPKSNAGDFYFGSVNSVRFLPDGNKVGVADQRRTNDAAGD